MKEENEEPINRTMIQEYEMKENFTDKNNETKKEICTM